MCCIFLNPWPSLVGRNVDCPLPCQPTSLKVGSANSSAKTVDASRVCPRAPAQVVQALLFAQQYALIAYWLMHLPAQLDAPSNNIYMTSLNKNCLIAGLGLHHRSLMFLMPCVNFTMPSSERPLLVDSFAGTLLHSGSLLRTAGS